MFDDFDTEIQCEEYFNDDEESLEDFTFDEEFFDGNEEFV